MGFFPTFVRLLLITIAGTPVTSQQRASDGRVILNIGFLTSKSGRFVSSGTIAAAELALECINERTDLLPGYYLNLSTYDTKCDEAASMDEYVQHWTTTSQPSPLFFAGGCSIATGLPGDMSRNYHTVQIAYTAGSPVFSDKKRYPYLFRALQPETGIHRGQAAFVKHFEWDEVAMVVQNEHLFAASLTDTVDYMRKVLNIQTVNTHIFPSRLPLEGLESLWRNTPRVIIINAYEAYTREILCQALRNNIYYPNYQFIILGWFSENFWLNASDVSGMQFTPSCTVKEFEDIALRNLITVNFDFLARNRDKTAICGESAKSFLEKFHEKRDQSGLGDSDFAGITFDAMYAAARALNVSIPILESNFRLKLEDFEFGNVSLSAKFASVVTQSLAEVNFTGVSGPFEFNKVLDRDQFQVIIGLYVNRNNSWHQEIVGEIKFGQEPIFQQRNSSSILFPAGIPRDQPKGVHVALYAVMTVLAVIFIACAVICFFFNLAFRNQSYIKMTSPNVSYFIPLGAIFLYAIVIAIGFPATGVVNRTIACNFQLWLGSLGFTLIFGGILVRTWRIHFIFNRIVTSKIKAKPPKDWMLITAIGVFLTIDLVFLVIVAAVPQTRTVATVVKPVASTFVVEVCNTLDSAAYLTMVIILVVYKSVYLWVGLYLAFETRKVKLKALADSQYIAASVYVSIMTCIAIVPVAIWLREMVDIYYGVLSGILMLGVTTVLALIFLPKMVGLYKYWNADMMEFELGRHTTSIGEAAASMEVATLQRKVQELTSKLADFDKSITDTNSTIKVTSNVELVSYNGNRTSELSESGKNNSRTSAV